MELLSYLLGKKSSGGGGTGPKIEAKNPLNASGGFQTNITKIGDFEFEGTSCQAMFSGFSSLEDVDFSNFTTANVTTYKYMFNNCTSLTKLDLSSFETSATNDLSYMFNGCTNLKEIDLRNFNTTYNSFSKAQVLNAFYDCSSLEKLDLRSFIFTRVFNFNPTRADELFGASIPKDCLIIVKDTEQKNFVLNNTGRGFENIQTVEEYEDQPL